ncbi:helix-turn-helix domain-containing protein [Actinomyces howellii]|uniref:helix-turn-helix domain-containing protein n=1 Tax=Actinomyces howellii TaxID=52771 RepID=UPI0018D524BE|nr:helix-turn-helix domain-containing protein [Actinomyces howellii]
MALLASRVAVTAGTIQELRELPIDNRMSIALRDADGREVPLPPGAQRMLLATLAAVAEQGEVTIGRVPEELTSTVAADLLGVSRPTVLKWSREGRIDSFKVGSHTRFRREDVLAFRAARERERRRAFDELRSLDAEGDFEFFVD